PRYLCREAAHERHEERAGGGGGREPPERGRAAPPLGERGEERDRHPEEHRDEVDGVHAEDLLPARRVAKALADRREGDARGALAAGWSYQADRGHREERNGE